MNGARIHIAEYLDDGEDIPTNDEIGKAVGSRRSNVSLIARTSLKRLQLRVVTEHVVVALPDYPESTIVDVVVYVIEQRHGYALACGEMSVDDVLSMMHHVGMERKAS